MHHVTAILLRFVIGAVRQHQENIGEQGRWARDALGLWPLKKIVADIERDADRAEDG